eukprot:GFUD01032478.1.p1 GENE.GFUD01032478.1~~GFUD01032478.1.p1  ORF type:complete len:132 (-),score=12.31 GFUD01032478.1:218-586(-)
MRCLFIFSLLLITAQSVPVRHSLLDKCVMVECFPVMFSLLDKCAMDGCSPDIFSLLDKCAMDGCSPDYYSLLDKFAMIDTSPDICPNVPSTITGEWCPVKFQKLTCVISSSTHTCTSCCCIS